ncbi:MAG: aldo/keto reductase [Parvibaculaceae bacterium]
MTHLPITPELRPLGKSGLSVFPIAYGMWRFAGTDPEAARAKLEAALDAGMTLFDTADIYGIDGGGSIGAAEELFGAALKLDPSLRARMVIATKGGISIGVPYDSGTDHLTATCEGSLKRMGIEHIDLYQIHRPDLLAHPQEVAATLTRLKEQGKIGHVGVSNHTAAQFEALQACLDFPIVTHQPEFSCLTLGPLFDGVLDQSMRRGVALLAWSPLAGGRLALAPAEAETKPDGARLAALIRELDKVAAEAGVAREAVALAWLLAHPAGVIPIIGTQNAGRIAAATDAFKVKLDKRTWYAILQASMGERLP